MAPALAVVGEARAQPPAEEGAGPEAPAAEASEAAPAGGEADEADGDRPPGPPADAPEPTVLPGEADGIAVEESDPTHALLWIPRVLLAAPRFALLVATEPLYQAARLEDEYHLQDRAIDFFFNDEETFGWYPTAFFETGLGLNVGARVVHTDLFGEGEGLTLRAGYGKVWKQSYGYSIGSGNRFGDMKVNLAVDYQRKRHKRFFGFGPEDEVEPSEVMLPLDVQDQDVAVRTFYRHEVAQGAIRIKSPLGPAERFDVQLTHQWRWRRFTSGEPELPEGGDADPWIDEIYEPSSVVGFGEQMVDNYNEVRLGYDDRKSNHVDLPTSLPSDGWKIRAWGGWDVHPGDTRAFGRVGLDVQPFVDLYNGDRVLRMRFRVDSVIGPIGQVPFVDRPTLGGPILLRGYPRDRFRGRTAALTQIEYRYPIQPVLAGYLFVDAGRVWEDGEGLSLNDFEQTRVGFGAGAVLFTSGGFLLGAQVSSSIDGGFHARMNLNTTDGLVETH